MKPSTYQQNIISKISGSNVRIAVNAVAGAGKSTLLKMIFEKLAQIGQNDVIFLTFNVSARNELNDKLKKCDLPQVAKNFHSVGYGCVANYIGKRLNVKSWKYKDISKAICKSSKRFDRLDITATQVCEKLRTDGLQPTYENIIEVACHFDINNVLDNGNAEKLEEILPEIFSIGEKQAKEGLVDFTDMLYLPFQWGLQPKKFKWALVDECQDLSMLQIDLVKKMGKENIIAVGDPRQAIYGFAGADHNSFENVKDGIKAEQMPLSICYRCASSILDVAREIVPCVENAPNAPQGTVSTIEMNQLSEKVKTGDLVLSRKNAPLFKLFFSLLKEGIPAQVKGINVGRNIANICKKISYQRGFQFSDFFKYCEKYFEKQLRKVKDHQMQGILDKQDAIISIYQAKDWKSVDEMANYILDMFKDKKNVVLLSTVHKAKGLEADNVFILHPEHMPLVWKNQQPWQYQQEMNIKYVAITRAKHSLTWVVK